jgi:peptidylprolyl isomerase
VPSNQQRREAERLRLQRQVEQRREREVARRRSTLIISIVATLALLAAVVSIIAVYAGGNSAPAAAHPPKPTPSLQHTQSPAPSAPVTPQQESSSSAAPIPPPTACATAKPGAKTVRFHGLTVRNASDLKHTPVVSGAGKGTAKTLECLDIVAGKGKAAAPNSTVTAQYDGVFYKNGKIFDSSWQDGRPLSFVLTPGKVITGFAAGIGGAGKVAPMHVGGRRIMILPAALAYGSSGSGSIPPNSTLVFVVDLLKVNG